MSNKKVSVFAPASMGNVSVGFDILGLCVKTDERQLGDVVSVEAASENEFCLMGEYQDVLPSDDKDNLVLKAKDLFLQRVAHARKDSLKITLAKNLPICSGLGSSAASVVAAIAALNEFYDKPLTEIEALELMGLVEADASGSVHYDNIAPSYLGGLTLCSKDSPQTYQLPWPQEWKLLLAYADIDVPTVEARKVLPAEYSKATVLEHAQNVAQFVHGLHAHDLALAANSIKDLIAEPYRTSLIPNFAQVKQTLMSEYGVKTVGISGSGPTIFAVTDAETKVAEARQYLQEAYVDHAVHSKEHCGFVVAAEIDRVGACLV